LGTDFIGFWEDFVMQVVRFGYPAVSSIHSQAPIDFSSLNIEEPYIGVSRWAETARGLISLHASHDKTIILEGERGAGKNLFARLIHRSSSRRRGPFVSLALGSTTDDLARAVLFNGRGEKSFTESVQGGTLYIDGLSEISASLADDIVHLIESQSSDGGAGTMRILLGSTTRNGFSNQTPISASTVALDYEKVRIPPLRDRVDDIRALAEYFIRKRCLQLNMEIRRITPEAMSVLCDYDWPRNVSELKVLINQLVKQLNPPSIDVSVLPGYMADLGETYTILPAAGLDLDNEVKRIEVDLICAALKRSHGLQNKAAQLLRIKPTTLFMKIRRYGIDVAAFR
jgi:two-component system response regulator PilR (NtrC family)